MLSWALYPIDAVVPISILMSITAIIGTYILARRLRDAADNISLSNHRQTEIAPTQITQRRASTVNNILPDFHDIPEALHYAWEILQHELQGPYKEPWLTEEYLATLPIQLVYSNYTGNRRLTSLQKRIADEIRYCGNGNERIISARTSDFREVPPELAGHLRLLYIFPMYLTHAKREAGFAIIPYGMQRVLGAMVPSTNPTIPISESRVWDMDRLLTEAHDNQLYIYTVSNYAVSEIIVQCIEKDEHLCRNFSRSKLLQLEPDLPNQNQADQDNYIHRMTKLNSDKWVFVFDLGDLHRIRSKLKASGRAKDFDIFRVKHSLDIPVGIGCNRYMVPWLLDNARWRCIHDSIVEEVQQWGIYEALRDIGIQVQGREFALPELSAPSFWHNLSTQVRI